MSKTKNFNKSIKSLNVYILPGGDGVEKGGWPGWIKNKLAKQGIGVYVCNIRENSPRLRAIALAKKYKLNSDIVIVGHSLGALTAIKWLEYKNKKIHSLFLVDPSVKQSVQKIWEQQKNTKIKNKSEKYLKAWSWKMDLNKVSKLANKKIILSENKSQATFYKWLKSHKEYAKQLEARLIRGSGERIHFTGRKEPLVLKCLEELLKIEPPGKFREKVRLQALLAKKK